MQMSPSCATSARVLLASELACLGKQDGSRPLEGGEGVGREGLAAPSCPLCQGSPCIGRAQLRGQQALLEQGAQVGTEVGDSLGDLLHRGAPGLVCRRGDSESGHRFGGHSLCPPHTHHPECQARRPRVPERWRWGLGTEPAAAKHKGGDQAGIMGWGGGHTILCQGLTWKSQRRTGTGQVGTER